MSQKLLKPLQYNETTLIIEVTSAAKLMNMPMFMVGAMARIILLEHLYGQQPSRASRDVDFAVVVDTWDEYDRLKHLLCSAYGFSQLKGAQHRLEKRVNSTYAELYLVDLIPFGGVQNQLEQLAWPPDMQIIMNVAGFSDALKSTIQIEIEQGIEVNVACLPAIALLKIIAWQDRSVETNGKDAIDLLTLCTQYLHPDNLERLYDQFDHLTVKYTDMDLAGAWMLGRDTRQISSANSASTVFAILNDSEKKYKMAVHMSQTRIGKNEPLDFCLQTIDAFLAGYGFLDLNNLDKGHDH